jgi:hypothetical protein
MNAKSIVKRGGEIGVVLTPHKHEDGRYVASLSRFERDYIRVDSLRELKILSDNGFSIRTSNPDSQNHKSPSLVIPGSIDWIT